MSDPECEVQRPFEGRTRFTECACLDLAHGGCTCDDDGSVNARVHFEAAEHERSGFPRRVDHVAGRSRGPQRAAVRSRTSTART